MSLLIRAFFILGTLVAFGGPALLAAREPKMIERVSFHALKKVDSKDPADRIGLRVIKGRVYGIWDVKGPVPKGRASPFYQQFRESPYWITDQIVFHLTSPRQTLYLVADVSVQPPELVLKKMQVDGFRWKADILKNEQSERRSSKHESILMYIGATDPAGAEYWLGFDDKPVLVKENDLQLELRELILTTKKHYAIQYTYRRYPDDGGK